MGGQRFRGVFCRRGVGFLPAGGRVPNFYYFGSEPAEKVPPKVRRMRKNFKTQYIKHFGRILKINYIQVPKNPPRPKIRMVPEIVKNIKVRFHHN